VKFFEFGPTGKEAPATRRGAAVWLRLRGGRYSFDRLVPDAGRFCDLAEVLGVALMRAVFLTFLPICMTNRRPSHTPDAEWRGIICA